MTTPHTTPAAILPELLDVLGLPGTAGIRDVVVSIEDLKAAVHDAEEGHNQPAAPLQQGEYLPLPEPRGLLDTGGGWLTPTHNFTGKQMRAYVDADRAARGAAQAAHAHISAMERAWLWMENQSDAQSKGGHETFDLMMLRDERDALREAIDTTIPASPAPVAEDADDAARWRLLPLFMQGYDVDWVELLYNLEVTFKRGVRAQAAQPEGGAKP